MLAGFDEPDAGVIQKPNALTLGYLPQDGLSHTGRTVVDEASLALKPLLDSRPRCTTSSSGSATPTVPRSRARRAARRATARCRIASALADGYQIELKVATVLRGLGFEPDDFEQQLTDHLSGGWQMRLALAKLLLQRSRICCCSTSRPTTSISTRATGSRTTSSRYPHSVILVSHDRYFLDAVVTRIADLSLRTITDYHCNYSQVSRAARRERSSGCARRSSGRTKRSRASRSSSIASATRRRRRRRCRAASRCSRRSSASRCRRSASASTSSFPAAPKSGRMVLELKDVRKAYGDKVVLDHVDLHIERGDRIALVGHNGAGKSTLMRMLSGEEPPDTGTRTEGHQVVMQYFAQDEATRLDPALTVYETLSAGSPHTMVPAIRNILGGFLFSGDDVYKKAGVLSGGERTRLAVARMLLRPSNTLLLDEPTNHLDIDSKEVLLDALADYGGTLIFVSHDRYFVERLATKIVEVGDGKATLYPGTYEEFLWSKAEGGCSRLAPEAVPTGREAGSDASPQRRPHPPQPAASPPHPPQTYDDRKREAAEKKQARARLQGAEEARRRARSPHRRARRRRSRTSSRPWRAPDFYDDHEKSQAGARPAPGADVGSRRAAGPVGDASERSRAVRRPTKFVISITFL